MQVRNPNVVRQFIRPMPKPVGSPLRVTYGGCGQPGFEGLQGCDCSGSSGKMSAMRGLMGLGAFALGANGTAADMALEESMATGHSPYETDLVVTDTMQKLMLVRTILGVVGATAGAVHGYKRNRKSVGWAVGWGAFGFFLPIIALPVMAVQGFGKGRRRR